MFRVYPLRNEISIVYLNYLNFISLGVLVSKYTKQQEASPFLPKKQKNILFTISFLHFTKKYLGQK
jgi:hypothetical protein